MCGFHREKAWEDWAKATKNGVSEHREAVLALMREVAVALTVPMMEEALSKLKTSEFWENSMLNVYFTKTWEPQILVRFHNLLYLLALLYTVLLCLGDWLSAVYERLNHAVTPCRMQMVSCKTL